MKLLATKHRRIGLFGGSFNPAHAGHAHIAQEALKRLQLDAVWWLVSPHNPLKAKDTLGDYAQRLESARALATHPRMTVSDIEQRCGLTYTYETIRHMQQHYPNVAFYWIMGADNLAGFHRWESWRDIFKIVPVVVFDRAPFSHTALRSKAAQYARKLQLLNNEIGHKPLTFFHMRRNPLSSTAIRKHLEKSSK